jgi:hypothetical protein
MRAAATLRAEAGSVDGLAGAIERGEHVSNETAERRHMEQLIALHEAGVIKELEE